MAGNRWTGSGVHRTRTLEWVVGERYKTKSNGSCGRYVPIHNAKAECICGWSQWAGDRAEARSCARDHRWTVAVLTADLTAFAQLVSELHLPAELVPPLRRLDETARSSDGEHVEAPLVDLRPLLHRTNQPPGLGEHPLIDRLISAVNAVSVPWQKIGAPDPRQQR